MKQSPNVWFCLTNSWKANNIKAALFFYHQTYISLFEQLFNYLTQKYSNCRFAYFWITLI